MGKGLTDALLASALKEALNNIDFAAPASWDPLRYQGSIGLGSVFQSSLNCPANGVSPDWDLASAHQCLPLGQQSRRYSAGVTIQVLATAIAAIAMQQHRINEHRW